MEFKQLRAFAEVIRQGGFTQAARTLHASQSAVSKQVAQLEQRLGLPLLERTGPHIRLTDAGQVVLRHAEIMLRQQQELRTELDDLAQLTRGELRLGLTMLGGDALFAAPFAEYRRRHPGVNVHLMEGGSKTVEQLVLNGELDLGASLTPDSPAFDCQPFCNEPLDVLLPVQHALASAPHLSLAQLADTPFVLYQQSFTLNDRLMRACRALGFTPKEGGRSGQADFLVALVAAGQGVLLLPRIVAQSLARPGVVSRPLHGSDLRWDIAFIWRRDGYLSRAARAWLALLEEYPAPQ